MHRAARVLLVGFQDQDNLGLGYLAGRSGRKQPVERSLGLLHLGEACRYCIGLGPGKEQIIARLGRLVIVGSLLQVAALRQHADVIAVLDLVVRRHDGPHPVGTPAVLMLPVVLG